MLIKGGFNWVDVRDVVQGTISSIKNGRSGQKYILSGHHCSLKDVAIILQQLFKRKTPSLIAPIFLAKLSLPFIQAYANISNTQPLFTTQSLNILINSPRYISNQKAQLDLGFMPRPFKESLQDTINWYKRHKQLK